MPRTDCLTAQELNALHLGELPETALADLAGHLEHCPHCEAAARALDDMPDTVAAAYRLSALAGPSPAAASLPGRVGEYEILAEVGRGGMGVVYQARHVRLQRTVALKMLLDGVFAHGEERARFRAEAEAVARLQHPHIVQIYEVGEHDAGEGLPRPYFTLEFAEGGNLASRLASRPQPARQAAAWVEALARAMHYAHQRGIVHRDLKPSNVLLTADGQPKVCDFGVAKFLAGADVKTLSGTVLGTAEYMAPEQAAGAAAVGPAADVYALGAILYTSLTGRPPFQGTSAWHTLEQVLRQEPVAPRRLQPGVPRDLDTICLKCLEKEPGRRYPSAEALADDLGHFLADRPIRARRPSPWERCARWVRHHKAITAALAVVIVTLAAAAAVSTVEAIQKEAARLKATNAEAAARAAQKRAEASQELAEERRELAMRNLYVAKTNLTGLTLDAPGGMAQVAQFLREYQGYHAREDPRGWEWYYCHTLARRAPLTLRGHTVDASALAWSPDGTQLASGGFDKTIRIWDATSGRELRSLDAPWGVLGVSWRPDGRRLASTNWFDRTVGIWDPASGKEVRARLKHPEHLWTAAYSPDGRLVAASDIQSRVIVWDADTGAVLLRLPATGKEGCSVSWSPDGRRLATSALKAVKIWDAGSGSELATLAGHTDKVYSVRWSPDGRKLASTSADRTIRIWDATAYSTVRTIPAPQVEELEDALCWSPDGRRLAGGGRDLAIRVWDVASGAQSLTLWGHTGSHICSVRWSPDGARLASAERGWNGTIRVWDLDQTPAPRTLTVGGAGDLYLTVCWDPDGRRLATVHKDGAVKLWDSTTGRRLFTLAGHTGAAVRVSWAPDGRTLATTGSDGTAKLWEAETGRLRHTLPGNGRPVHFLSWSPDGSQLMCNNADTAITLWEVATGASRLATFKGEGAAWSPKANRIAVGDGYKIRLHDADTDRQVALWPNSASHHNHARWSPDGTRIATIADYAVEVRDAATGLGLYPPLGHTQRVQALAWSPDGKQLATATEDNRIHLWDAVTGNPILVLRGQNGPVTSVAWSPDGMRLAYATSLGTITIWDATPGYESERAPALLPRLDARLAARPGDANALRLRAGAHARQGAWGRAAADAESLGKLGVSGFFQAGWWVADASPAGRDLFAAVPQPEAPRWYVAADDPNGYVPLAKDQPYYLTRIYAPREQQVDLQFVRHKDIAARLWLNGNPVTVRAPTSVRLRCGWNTVAVRLDIDTTSSSVLLHPREGFYLRLDARTETGRPSPE